MKVCPNCIQPWDKVGKSYKRRNSNKVDHYCLECQSKRKPIEVPETDFDSPYAQGGIVDVHQERVFDPINYEWKSKLESMDNDKRKEFVDTMYEKINTPSVDDLVEFTDELTPNPYYKGNTKRYENLLLIGDLHAPANLPNYLDFCSDIYDKYNCDHVIFMGDLIDLHASSFHSTDPDGLNAGDELDAAVNEIQRWNDIFPVADVVLGNHDLIVMRKAYKEGISKRWIKDFNDVLGVKWNFQPSFEYNNCLFRHGLGMKASPKAGSEMMNVIQSHFHTESYINYKVGRGKMVFGMQVPCGINREHYSMVYAKEFPKQAIGCGVLLEYGRLPIIEMCDL